MEMEPRSPYEILVTAPDQPHDLVLSDEIRSTVQPLGELTSL